jgi:hypothetical protein
MFDWPRYLFQRLWRMRLPRTAAFAWYPVSVFALALSAFVPQAVGLFVLFPVALLALIWSYAAHPQNLKGTWYQRLRVTLVSLGLLNLPIALLASVLFAVPGSRGSVAVLVAAVLAEAFGQVPLAQAWRAELSSIHRKLAIGIGMAVALGLAAAMLFGSLDVHADLTLAAALVLLHRPATTLLSRDRRRLRYYVLLFPFLAMARALGPLWSDSPGIDARPEWLAEWFVFGVMVGLGLALFQEGELQA